MRVTRAVIVVAAVAVLVAGCASVPSASAGATTTVPGFGHAVLLEDVVPHWGPQPGQELLDDWGEHPYPVGAGRVAVLLSDPVPGPGGPWVRAWLAPDPQTTPGDIYVWLPVTREGREVLRLEAPPACPPDASIDSVTSLLAPDRFRCYGDRELTIDAKSWLAGTWPTYDVDPAWYGTNRGVGDAVSLYSAAEEARPPDARIAWLDARVPPGVEAPPKDFVLRVTGRFGHDSADKCTRVRNLEGWVPRPPPGAGVPVEAPDDSVRWCRQQFVMTAWEPVLGPEGRAFDPTNPQLHRSQVPPPGVLVACGGVGMPPLHIRIDSDEVDPVWIEPAGQGRSLAVFGPEFRLELDGQPRVTAPNGVVLLDGDIIDPDRGAPGLDVCPGGDVVTFSMDKPGA